MSSIKAVTFDLGGTLWEHRPGLTMEGILTGVAPRAIALLPPDQAARLAPGEVAVAVRRAYLDLEHAAGAGDTSPVPPELPVIRGLAALDVAVDAEIARAMLRELYVPESRTTRLLPGAEALLQALALRSVRLGIISNRLHGGTLLLNDLDYFGISHYFVSMVTSSEVGQMKPHPALFRRALDDLGVTPQEAVMVGDDLQADIAGARAMGMRALWLRRPPDRSDPSPEGVPDIRHLDEALPALDRMGL